MIARQFIALFAVVAAAAADGVWRGPFADHLPGHLVGDTADVAAAKRQHAEAHSRVRAILPELPPEEIFGHDNSGPQYPFVPHNPHHVQQPFGEPSTRAHFTHFAEEIPRSAIGEVPEVAAAREAHLAAHLKTRQLLDRVNVHDVVYRPTTVEPYHGFPSQGFYVNNNQVNTDTPEVAAAKLEHARAYAAFAG